MNSICGSVKQENGTVGWGNAGYAIRIAYRTDNTRNSIIGVGDLVVTNHEPFVNGVCKVIGRIDNVGYSVFCRRGRCACLMA